MRWIRWFAAAFGVLFVVAAGIVVFLATLDLDSYKEEIQAAVRAETGRDLAIIGPLKLTWLPQPALAASEVRLANADWGSTDSMATIGDMRFGIELLPLLSGQLDIRGLLLKDVLLVLERNADGLGNWQFGGTGTDGPGTGAAVPAIQSLALEGITVVWKEPDAERTFRVARMTLAADPPGATRRLVLEADIDGDPVTLEGTVPAIAEVFRPGASLPVDVAGTVAGSEVRLAANFALLRDGRGVLSEASADRLEVAYGPVALAGSATLSMAGERPLLAASLKGGVVDLSTLPAADGGAGPDAGSPLDRPLPLGLLTGVDGKLELSLARLVTGDLALDDVAVMAVVDGGVLTVRPASATLSGGPLTGELTLDAGKRPARFALKADWTEADFGRLARDLAKEGMIDALGDAGVDLTGAGDTPRAMLASADGVARLVVREGDIRNDTWELIADDLATRFLPFLDDSAGATLNCAAMRWEVARGTARSKILMLDSSRVVVAGTGTVDLGRQTMEIHLVPEPKNPALLSLATPIYLRGPIEDFRVEPDAEALAKGVGAAVLGTMVNPAMLLLPFISSGAGDDLCPNAIAVAEGRKPSKVRVPSQEQDKPGGIKGLFESLRKAVE